MRTAAGAAFKPEDVALLLDCKADPLATMVRPDARVVAVCACARACVIRPKIAP
jgi:hypothetical protein